MQDILADLFERDLRSFEENLSNVPERLLWFAPEGVTNSAGVLTQHITGNLMFYVGAVLGGVEYQRDRNREFSNTGASADELLHGIRRASQTIPGVIRGLTNDQLTSPYPTKISFPYSTQQFLIHLYGHLSYHLGQLNYLRRIAGKVNKF
ncbi:MAG TPA: DUF1572 family protein [Balneolales bacterium]|jgi:uncharacterized damage-inducible protein DinB|nr:DUF1572 family protein [Balneolales bacterium]